MKTKKPKTARNKIGVGALADKYECSTAYIGMVVKQDGGKTILAQKIMKDFKDIVAILERETVITV